MCVSFYTWCPFIFISAVFIPFTCHRSQPPLNSISIPSTRCSYSFSRFFIIFFKINTFIKSISALSATNVLSCCDVCYFIKRCDTDFQPPSSLYSTKACFTCPLDGSIIIAVSNTCHYRHHWTCAMAWPLKSHFYRKDGKLNAPPKIIIYGGWWRYVLESTAMAKRVVFPRILGLRHPLKKTPIWT